MDEFSQEDLGAVALILFVDGDDLTHVWPTGWSFH